jgi:DNA repair protein RecO (recombination protein O)
MATRALPERHDDQPGFVLHAYPYKETSLVVEAFAREFGRIGLVAKGARRPRSELRGVLQAFQPIALSWAGATELKTLIRAEWRGGVPLPAGRALLSAFYLNELLLKLLPREDAHPALFDEYEQALAALAGESSPPTQAAILRRFELVLLAELGYALPLTSEAGTGAPIDPSARYHYAFDKGAHRHAAEPGVRWPLVRGATLIALSEQRYPDAEVAADAKRLMREVIDHYLESRRIESRRIAADLAALVDDAPERGT